MVLTNEDIVSIISHLISLVNSKVDVDDIDYQVVTEELELLGNNYLINQCWFTEWQEQ